MPSLQLFGLALKQRRRLSDRVLTPSIWVKGGRWSMMKEIERWPSCKPVDRLAPSI